MVGLAENCKRGIAKVGSVLLEVRAGCSPRKRAGEVQELETMTHLSWQVRDCGRPMRRSILSHERASRWGSSDNQAVARMKDADFGHRCTCHISL
jgi:hypothetical protein